MTFDDWLEAMRVQAAAEDDGSSAETPEYGPTTFDEISQQWTRALPEAMELWARIAVLEAELAKERAGKVAPAPIKSGIPARALCFGRQNIGLQMPEGF